MLENESPASPLKLYNSNERKSEFEENMEHACRTYHLIMTKTLKKNLEILFELKKNITNRPILIFGHSGVKKSLLMKNSFL